jgi:hypothetical protein
LRSEMQDLGQMWDQRLGAAGQGPELAARSVEA